MRTLPVRVRFSAPGPQAFKVYLCNCCATYHRTEFALIEHLTRVGTATAVREIVGDEGLHRYVEDRCKRYLAIEPRVEGQQEEDAAVDAAVAVAEERYRGRAQPVVAPGLPAVVDAVIGFPIRVHFSAPLVRGSALVSLTEPSVNALGRIMAIEYAKIAGEAHAQLVDWNARFNAGVPVRYHLQGGGNGKQVLQVDGQLAVVFRDIRFMEAFVGDRKEHGGESAHNLE